MKSSSRQKKQTRLVGRRIGVWRRVMVVKNKQEKYADNK